MRRARGYPSDLTDAQWQVIAGHLPAEVPGRRGRPRVWPLRQIVEAILYVDRAGCAWRYLPDSFPPWPTVYGNCLHWVRDVPFGEDASTARTGTGPHVMAALRNLVISILRMAGHVSIAAALRHTARDPLRAFRLLTGRK